jgi:hypothetical protein
MKTTVTQGVPDFQPIYVSITIESAKELKLFCNMMAANIRIPNMLEDDGSIATEDRSTLTNMMSEIYRGNLQKYLAESLCK